MKTDALEVAAALYAGPADSYYDPTWRKEAFITGAKWAKSQADLIDKWSCHHPGCCCVCGHTGRCPEDGVVNGGVDCGPVD